MKKKYSATVKDKLDWIDFTKRMEHIRPKEIDNLEKEISNKKIRKLDLHGLSLNKANEKIEEFIIDSFEKNFKKLLIVTGRGTRSKSYDDPYVSEKLGLLKYSIPEFINNEKNLSEKISSVAAAELKDGGEGAIYVFLKNKRNFKE